jgi:hypothetical protein
MRRRDTKPDFEKSILRFKPVKTKQCNAQNMRSRKRSDGSMQESQILLNLS